MYQVPLFCLSYGRKFTKPKKKFIRHYKKKIVCGNRTRELFQVDLMTLWLNSESRYKFSGKIFIKKNKWLDITRIIHFQTKISQVLCKINYIPEFFFKLPFRMQSFLITRFFLALKVLRTSLLQGDHSSREIGKKRESAKIR